MEKVTKAVVSYDAGDPLDYRGVHVDFNYDPIGQQMIAVWKGKLVEFGVDNTMYKDDMKMLIDEDLDTVTRFESIPEFYGSKLEYFQNGPFRDLRLVNRTRIVKVYLGVPPQAVEADAVETLRKYIQFNKSIN